MPSVLIRHRGKELFQTSQVSETKPHQWASNFATFKKIGEFRSISCLASPFIYLLNLYPIIPLPKAASRIRNTRKQTSFVNNPPSLLLVIDHLSSQMKNDLPPTIMAQPGGFLDCSIKAK